jgi:hypothetical protein
MNRPRKPSRPAGWLTAYAVRAPIPVQWGAHACGQEPRAVKIATAADSDCQTLQNARVGPLVWGGCVRFALPCRRVNDSATSLDGGATFVRTFPVRLGDSHLSVATLRTTARPAHEGCAVSCASCVRRWREFNNKSELSAEAAPWCSRMPLESFRRLFFVTEGQTFDVPPARELVEGQR